MLMPSAVRGRTRRSCAGRTVGPVVRPVPPAPPDLEVRLRRRSAQPRTPPAAAPVPTDPGVVSGLNRATGSGSRRGGGGGGTFLWAGRGRSVIGGFPAAAGRADREPGDDGSGGESLAAMWPDTVAPGVRTAPATPCLDLPA